MGSKIHKPTAVVADTLPATVSGTAAKHPVWKTLRAVAGRITTPLLPDDYLQLANPLWSARELRGRIVEVRRETTDSRDVGHQAGLGIPVRLPAGPVRRHRRARRRPLAVAVLFVDLESRSRRAGDIRPERPQRTITVTVKAMPEGFLSTHLVGGVAPGTIVRLAAPQGNFVMPDPAPASVLFLTGGSGITPVMSMLRTLARRDQITDVLHIHCAPTESDVMFAAELAELAREKPGYRLRVRTTRTQGRLDLRRLGDDVPDWRERETWACGPQGMLEAAERVWADAGIAGRLHLERFAVSKAAPHGQGGAVTFARSGKTRRGRCGHVADGCRRKRRCANAFRLPNGHLPVVRGGPGRRPRPRSAHRRRA